MTDDEKRLALALLTVSEYGDLSALMSRRKPKGWLLSLDEAAARAFVILEVKGHDGCAVRRLRVDGEAAILQKFGAIKAARLQAADYGKTWRCWSDFPTDKQRKAARWNE